MSGVVFVAILGGVTFIERLASRESYSNPWMVLREDDIRRPDGSAGIYSVVDKPSYALVMPYDGRRFGLVEQFRYPIGERRWEFPQGTAPELADADPVELARRELREETGWRATTFEPLGRLDVAPGMSSQRGWVFLATGIVEGEAHREHEEQDMRSAWTGVIADAQSIAPAPAAPPTSWEVSASHWPAVATSSGGRTCIESCPITA
ncbi:ADP-ribose pyrophosphatase [Mycobacterium lepraemurium]|nr:NUDIX hydrolase [Mycobacterium lepraemurium]ATA28058.1 ADP-ribose pyrophosphatase [Mycobacterium lepraemurium]